MGDNRFNMLWKAHFIDRHVKAALQDLFNDEKSGLIRLIRKQTPELTPAAIRESLRRADIRIDFPVMPHDTLPPEASDPPKPIKTKPRSRKKGTGAINVEISDLIRAGLIAPPFTVESMYKGVHLTATIQPDGAVIVGNQAYRLNPNRLRPGKTGSVLSRQVPSLR